jgi:KaiC/GvpD/RAD55 family RecA-like ATPase
MDSKITYLRGQISGLNSQLAADNGKSNVLQLLQKASALLQAREDLNEPVNVDNVESLCNQIYQAVASYNANNQISMDSVKDIMAGLEAVPEVEETEE